MKCYNPIYGFEVLTAEGFKDFDGVLMSNEQQCVTLSFNDNSELTCTADHKLQLSDGSYIEAINVSCSDVLTTVNSKKLSSIKASHEQEVFDLLNVKDTSSYLTNGVVSHNCLMIDELAFVNPTIQEAMWASLAPTLATGGQCIISSTPNGDQELFSKLWRAAEAAEDGAFYPVAAFWYQHPERGNGDPTSPAALAYKQGMIAKVGELVWRQEYEAEFLSSDPLLISSLVSNSWKAEEPLFKDSGFSFWERIDPKKEYLVGADVAEGLEKDYSSIEVFDTKLVQIAEFRSNKISESELYDKIKWIINYIISSKDQTGAGRHAKLMWSYENNSCGKVISSLYYKDEKFPDDGELISVGEKLGMNTNASTKKEASKNLKRLLESSAMKIKSKDLINEFKNYAQVGRSDGIYNAKPGATDDSISATLIVTRLFTYVTSYDDDAFDRLYKSKIGTGEERELDGGGGDIEPMPMAIL
jgi:hypothetical protein